MPCDPIRDADGQLVGIACDPWHTKVRCEVRGCGRTGDYLCDYPLAGAAAGRTCSRPVCAGHRVVRPEARPDILADGRSLPLHDASDVSRRRPTCRACRKTRAWTARPGRSSR